MKELNMLIWLSQLGLSTALPPAFFCVLGLWLHRGKGWGEWAIWFGLVLGLLCAVQGFRHSLKIMTSMADSGPREPPKSYHDHK